MSEKYNGGPAFPRTQWTGSGKNAAHRDVSGMTLRDWFAGQAMQGLLASNRAVSIDRDPHESISIASYAQADAMLAERDK